MLFCIMFYVSNYENLIEIYKRKLDEISKRNSCSKLLLKNNSDQFVFVLRFW